MRLGMGILRGGLLAALIMVAVPLAGAVTAVVGASPAVAQSVASIEVEGNRRIEADTIRSYFKAGPDG